MGLLSGVGETVSLSWIGFPPPKQLDGLHENACSLSARSSWEEPQAHAIMSLQLQKRISL